MYAIDLTPHHLSHLHWSDKFDVKCEHCNSIFCVKVGYLRSSLNGTSKIRRFCTKQCVTLSRQREVKTCKNCSTSFTSKNKKQQYCSSSCSAKYNNTHKTHGCRRSKLEVWLETQLVEKYPTIEIEFNRKTAINSELDIYVPRLKLAFELNGIFHYSPIFSDKQLEYCKQNDTRKQQACVTKGIELHTLNTSTQNYFSEKTAQPFLNTISTIIDKKISVTQL